MYKLFRNNILAACVLLACSQANALPLLSESAALNVANNLVLFPDHQDPNKFYFFPRSSELVRDKQNIPMFSFVYSGLNEAPVSINAPHGMMSMVHRLAPSSQQVAAIEQFLKANPKAGVAVIPVRSGVVELKNDSGAAALRQLFVEFNFPKHGPNSDGEVGINAVLNHFGAKLLRGNIMGNGNSFLNTHYCFAYQGLGPVMDAKISVEMKRVYEHYKASAGGGWKFWVRADVAREVEKLVDQRAVSWVVNGGDATHREYIRRITDEIIARIFIAELKAEPGAGVRSRAGAIFSVRHESTLKTELKKEVWTIVDREMVTNEECTHLSFDDVRPYKDRLVVDADKYGGLENFYFMIGVK